MAKTPTPAAAPRSAPAADQTGAGSSAPVSAPAPNVTVDANAPVDPVIAKETEALRQDATGQHSSAAEGGENPTPQESPAADAPVTGLGAAASQAAAINTPEGRFGTVREAPGAGFGTAAAFADQHAWVQPAAPRDFSRAGDRNAIGVRVIGVAGSHLELDRSVRVSFGRHLLFYFPYGASEFGEHVAEVISSSKSAETTELMLVGSVPVRPTAPCEALLVLRPGTTWLDHATAPEIGGVVLKSSSFVPDQVPLAAPAVQPTAVVDPAFVRVAASAKVVEVKERLLRLNTEVRSEPDHFYGVRYVDVDGAPRIVRLEAFVGPTDKFYLAGDFLPPIKGADVQIGVLVAPVDVDTGQRIRPDGYLALRSLGDGTAIAVTIDGRKIKVGLL